MRRAPLAAAIATTLLALIPAAAQASSTATGRLLVTVEPHAGLRSVADGALAAAGAGVAGPVVPELHLVTVDPPVPLSLTAAATLLRGLPGVSSVQIEHRFSLRYTPNDPALSTPEPAAPSVPIEWWAAKEDLPKAWDITRGTGAKVAIIDTGLDINQPDLAGKVAGSTDNDSDPNTGAATGDEVGHGTHVSSLACGAGNNGVGMVGAGFNCQILIFKSDFSDASVAQSITQAVDQGADAINMSFGTDGTTPAADIVVRAIDYAYDHNVIMTSAAADDPIQEQGDPSNVLQPTGTGSDITKGKGLSVTAASFADTRASFAGLGSQVSIAAYGTYAQVGGPPGIFGAFPGNQTSLEVATLGSPACQCRTTFNGDNRYAYLQGTSMASPMVAAVAALVRHLNPGLKASTIIRLLKQTARRPAGTGWTDDLGWGILDGGAAVDAARKIDETAPKSKVKTAHSTIHSTTVTLSFTSSDKAPKHCVPSGVAKVQLWRSINGRAAHRVLSTTKSSLKLNVHRGSKYAFYTVAVDKAGNKESKPPKPDVRLTVARS